MPAQVLTARRARVRTGRGRWIAGRMLLTERRLLVVALDGAPLLDVEPDRVRLARLPRPALVVETAGGSVRVRCFGVAGVAGLADAAGRAPDARRPTPREGPDD